MSRRLSLFLALAVAVLALAGPAGAITREQANDIALAVLAPAAETGSTVLFGLPKALKAKDVVTEFATRGVLKKPGKAVWLFWEDFDPGAYFQHPSRILLVDDKSGKVALNRSLSYFPLVNRKTPAFLQTETGFNAPGFQVFSNLTPATPRIPSAVRGSAEAQAPPSPTSAVPSRSQAVPAGSLDGDCVLLVVHTPANQREKSNGVAAMKAWASLAAGVGMPTYVANGYLPSKVGGPGDLQPPAAGAQVDDSSIGNNFKDLTSRGCEDILVYILGHGTPPVGWNDGLGHLMKGGPAAVTTGVRPPAKPGGPPSVKKLTPGGLVEAVAASEGKATFKFVIESCFAERFDELINQPNVKIVAGSSAPDKTSLMNVSHNPKYAQYTPAVPNPLQPEFTHGMTEGFKQTIANPAEVDTLFEAGDSFLARLIKASFAKEGANDRGALAGETNPSVHDNLSSSSIDICGTWRHNGPGDSELRISVKPDPPLPGAKLSWRVTTGSANVTFGGSGSATLGNYDAGIVIDINDYGRYVVEVTIEHPTLPGGKYVEQVEITVTSAPGPACS